MEGRPGDEPKATATQVLQGGGLTDITNWGFPITEDTSGPQKTKSRLGGSNQVKTAKGDVSLLGLPGTGSDISGDAPPVEVMRASTRSTSRRIAASRLTTASG